MARYDNIVELDPDYDGSKLKIGIIMSRFNLDVCEGLLATATTALAHAGVQDDNIMIVTVPGALEIPLVARKMADSGKFDAIVALGAVIRGDTYHFEVVSNEMASGISRIQLDTGVPIANGVLTTDTEHQALARMKDKGRDVALTAIEMARLLQRL
jgi:6,7-dimethyl-8-ribityllumazine synthase